MDMNHKMAAIEAVLFAEGEAVEGERIAKALELPLAETLEVLKILQERYEEEDRGIRLLRLSDAWQLCTKKEYYDELIRIEINAKKPHLTDVLMETLAIIAYKQPVTRQEIEQIRGVSSDHAVNRLIEFGLVKEAGRLDAPGRPILLATSREFLRFFGLSEAGDLPEMNPVKIADFQAEAEKEILQNAEAETTPKPVE